jgi:hypothetical protein
MILGTEDEASPFLRSGENVKLGEETVKEIFIEELASMNPNGRAGIGQARRWRQIASCGPVDTRIFGLRHGN